MRRKARSNASRRHEEAAQRICDIRFADEVCQPGSDLAEPRPPEVPITDAAAGHIEAADNQIDSTALEQFEDLI